ncbi:ABC transporter permease [Metabacillus sediminilitoris]|uniref:Iron export ABC transporter permease subunit FetB n=1 Tax=Metabacillus sediminilitoris TaxID=2567941 RepID=A0A4S4BVS1_9BACI|nr:iron export ABC transporter permease subunit FetB [Metabacillus sediminilitoris]QGQ46210.1 iron export ABC transporter permease subunit FetB [Metabacillus sediminilitoris]THF79263.1 iron export ABC transporter permease subunit FetB [Metabacillus sediminilitoris]
MDNVIRDIEFWRLAAAYIFILILIVFVKWRGIKREKRIIISTARMTIQLILVGYILTYIFEQPNPYLIILIVLFMLWFAINNTYKQVTGTLSKKLKQIIAISMAAGSLITLIYFNLVVIHFQPWYEPQYLIPIAGMIIGNSMTGITLGVKNLIEGMQREKHLIEGALMLGAKPEIATKSIVNSAFDSAILPTINNMVGMGIVFLPGMMTGQILAGISPLTAIEYQIAILLGIAGSVALTVMIFTYYGYRAFFNDKQQFLSQGK